MKPASVRNGTIVLGGLLVILGLVLAFLPVSVPQKAVVNQQQVLCQNNVGVTIQPQQTLTYQCTVVSGGWATISISSKVVLSFDLTLTRKPGGGTALINSTSGKSFTADLPSLSNGTLTLHMTSAALSPSTVSGSFTSSVQTNALYVYSQMKYIYRYYGVAMLALGALTLFLVIWDPRKWGTRAIDWVSRRI